MAICLTIHFKHDFTGWGNYDRCVEYLNSMAEKLRKSFGLTKKQIDVYAMIDKDWEEEDKADYEASRYGIRIDEPLWIDCHLEDGFWVIETCEAYSWPSEPESDTPDFVKQIVRVFGGHDAYVTEEMADWLQSGEPDMPFESWVAMLQEPLWSGFYRPTFTVMEKE